MICCAIRAPADTLLRVLFLTVHAVRQMERRGITRDEVAEALASPSKSTHDSENPYKKVVLSETAAGRRLKVVVLAEDTEHVVTVADRDQED